MPSSAPPRYTTLLCGEVTFKAPSSDQQDITFLHRIVREETSGQYFIHGFDEPFASLDDAKRRVESGEGGVAWWDSCAGAPGEPVCFVCGAYNRQMEAPERYPKRLCGVCVLEAVDEAGRPLRFSDASFSGGFEAVYGDTGQTYDGHVCYVRGVKCRADEAYFGGIVVQALEDAR